MDVNLQKAMNSYQAIEWNWDTLLYKEFNKASLEELRPRIERIKNFFDEAIEKKYYESIPDTHQSGLPDPLNQFISQINNIRDNYQSHMSSRTSFIRKVDHDLYNIFTQIRPYMYDLQSRDTGEYNKRLRQELKKAQEIKQWLEQEKEQIAQLIQHIKGQSANIEAHKYGNFFEKEAKRNKIYSWVNFGLMMVSIAGSVIFGIYLLENIGVNYTTQRIVTVTQNIFTRLLLLSFAGYLVRHFAKGYSAERHLYNLNTQRQNALNSHQQILDSIVFTKNESAKITQNAILVELTKAIFENKDTGYIKNSEKNSINVSPNLST